MQVYPVAARGTIGPPLSRYEHRGGRYVRMGGPVGDEPDTTTLHPKLGE